MPEKSPTKKTTSTPKPAPAPTPTPAPAPQQPQYYVNDGSKGLGVAAIILTFFFSPVGLVLGILAYSAGKRFEQTTGYKSEGRTLGLVSLIISAISLGIFLIYIIFMIIFVASFSSGSTPMWLN